VPSLHLPTETNGAYSASSTLAAWKPATLAIAICNRRGKKRKGKKLASYNDKHFRSFAGIRKIMWLKEK